MLHELVKSDNTAMVIKHNLEAVKTIDWLIDLGRKGRGGGGVYTFVSWIAPQLLSSSTTLLRSVRVNLKRRS
jgi:excinuclease UvrABC ATPase subunit